MNHQPNAFEPLDPDAEKEADRRAEDDIRAGRVVPHEVVMQWLRDRIAGKPTRRPRADG
ncbi:antitoxin [Sphingomonas sp.]|uniref:antitoxin n=1 Tax=Sphingomonas sp. TaxID=28214 RepID=UPI00286D839A|nr:antitoxin [Sphingomonas sp.]